MTAKPHGEASAIEGIEEAVHLLRRAPVEAFAIYYAGTVPFTLALLFFWGHTTWFLPSDAEIAVGALGLTLLFVAMKALQSEFCARLMAFQLGAPAPAWSWRRIGRLALAQLELQPWASLGTALAAVLAFPFGWVFAYGQIATVLGSDEHLHRTSVAQARLWPASNHLALLLISAVAFSVWGNLLATFFAVPWLANRLLGIDNIFGWSGWDFVNSTFLVSVSALTWLLVDPLVKAWYTLWVFYGRSRRTGDDVRVELQRARRNQGGGKAALAAVVLCLAVVPVEKLSAEEARSSVRADRLDQAIDRVLEQPEFSWRLQPMPKMETAEAQGAHKGVIRQAVAMLKDGLRWIGRKLRAVGDWVARHVFPDRPSQAPTGDAASAIATLKAILYTLIGGASLLILWVVFVVYRQAQRQARSVASAQTVVPAAPDLRDESVQAAQLPAGGWLALAREQIGRGEWRLAWRALYLATLARLSADGLISLARFKTNLDYERELRRRALSRLEIVGRFAARRRDYEAVWYGSHDVDEQAVRTWLAELERRVAS